MAASALVLFSGGQDSTTCLAWALDRFERVETVGFDYGQRHRIELKCRETLRTKVGKINAMWSERLGDDHRIPLAALEDISNSALTSSMAIEMADTGLPNTFVPGRNLIFLTVAAALAHRRELEHIVGGMCETDFSGYPDCRNDTMKALQTALNLGMEKRLVLDTPLMWIDKARTWQLAKDLGGKELVDTIIENSHTCHLGVRGDRHEWGYGCGICPACDLRAKGYRTFLAQEVRNLAKSLPSNHAQDGGSKVDDT
ncbi:7-cyano-7-deazaguanine synthase QueC [Rhizobium jaguaris]|uniref:7-cyano-7-deazaguanine synthase n=1 Tax=Rhizobium jaguaris TaxID=1312183 RepID=A0A387G7Z5_9HYPH|nr:7-cyano-7-deazaguanine synthase QueC [Rhizobium jaguaris]AYG63991.1 7-cyano-7-deazaguanine synthase QueC [Rhizobium jaguaris]